MSDCISIAEYRAQLAKPKRPKNLSLSKRDKEIKELREQQIPGHEIAKRVIIPRNKLHMSWHLEPEQRICVQFADLMRAATLDYSFRGVWGHLPNEGKRSPIVAAIMKAMGLLPGGTDYFFLWEQIAGYERLKDHAVIEFKTPGNKLSATQEVYRDWCLFVGVKHAVCTSAEEGIETLKGWGAIHD